MRQHPITRMLSKRRFWIGLGLIILVGAILRFSTYRFGLPYFDQFDEPEFFYEAAFQRGLIPSWLHPNPSQGLIALYKLAQVIDEAITHDSALAHPADIVSGMRFVSVILSLATLVLIGLCARELIRKKEGDGTGDIAGWLAAATWTVIPQVIYYSFIAIAEPWMMLFGALSLYAAALTLRRNGILWPLVSVWAGLIAFAFKYSMFPFAGIGLVVVLWRWWVGPPTLNPSPTQEGGTSRRTRFSFPLPSLWGKGQGMGGNPSTKLPEADLARRRTWLMAAGLQIVSIVVFLAALVVFGGLAQDVGSPSREVAVFFNNPLSRLANLNYVSGIVAVGFWEIGLAPAVFAVISVVGLLILIRQGNVLKNPRLVGLVVFILLGMFCAVLVPLYLSTNLTTERYFFAADLVFVIVVGCCAALEYETLREFTSPPDPLSQTAGEGEPGIVGTAFSLTTHLDDGAKGEGQTNQHDLEVPRLSAGEGFRVRDSLALPVLFTLLIAIWLGPLAAQSVSDTLARLKPYTLTDMTVWASHSLGEGGILTEGLGHRAFTREFGGYTGILRQWAFYGDLQSSTPAQWQQQGYRYAELVTSHVQELEQTPSGRAYLDSMQELRQFPPPDQANSWIGPAFVVYQLYRPQTALDVTFGSVFHLVGVDGIGGAQTVAAQTLAAPGETRELTFYWQAPRQPTTNYSLFVHLEPVGSDNLIAQADGFPGPTGRPTLTWNIPSETLISDPFLLTLPGTIRPGQYRLLIGLYDAATGQRLQTPQGDSMLLTTLTVGDVF